MASGSSRFFVVWTDDEVELLLRVTLKYKQAKLQENVDWESCQSKYADIWEAFLENYPSTIEAAAGKDFPHDKTSISKPQLTSKVKSIRGKFRQAVDSGRRSGHGRVVLIFFELCEELWGESPTTRLMVDSPERVELQDKPIKEEEYRSSSPPSSGEESAGYNPPQEAAKMRREQLQAKLNSQRGFRLKRKLHTDPAVQEDLDIKRKMVDLLEESERRNAERLDQITNNISTITNTIHEGFALLKNLMSQSQHPVSAAAERTERQRDLEVSQQIVQQRIRDREKDVKLLQQELEAVDRSADKAVEDSEKIFTELIRLVRRRSSDVKQRIRSQQETEVSRVKDLQEKLQQEISELKRKELKQLSHTHDHIQFLHNYPSLSQLGEATSSINIRPLRLFEDVTAAVSELRGKLQDILRDTWTNTQTGSDADVSLSEAEPDTRARYSHEITLDPNTAHTCPLLSEGNIKVEETFNSSLILVTKTDEQTDMM